jgi:hypothetical protein
VNETRGVSRPSLLNALADQLPPNSIRFNSSVTAASPSSSGEQQLQPFSIRRGYPRVLSVPHVQGHPHTFLLHSQTAQMLQPTSCAVFTQMPPLPDRHLGHCVLSYVRVLPLM